MRWNNMKDDLETIIRKHVTPVPTSLQGPLDKFPKQRQLYSKVISVNEEALLRIGTHEQDMDVSQNVWKDYMSSTVLNTPLGKIQEFIVTSKVHDGDTGAITTLKTFGEGELSAIAAAVRRICERAPVEVDQLDYNTRVLIVQAAIITAVPTGIGNLQLENPKIVHTQRDKDGRATVSANAHYFDSTTFRSTAVTLTFRMAAEYSLQKLEFPDLGFELPQTTGALQDETECGGFSVEEQRKAMELVERHRIMIMGKVASREEIMLYATYLRTSISESVSVARAGPYAMNVLFTIKLKGGIMNIMPSTQVAKDVLPAVLPIIKCSVLAASRIAGAIQHIWLVSAQIERAWEAGCRLADLIMYLEATDPEVLDNPPDFLSDAEAEITVGACNACYTAATFAKLHAFGSTYLCKSCYSFVAKKVSNSWNNLAAERLRSAMKDDLERMPANLKTDEFANTFSDLIKRFRREENGVKGWWDEYAKVLIPDPDPAVALRTSGYQCSFDAIKPVVVCEQPAVHTAKEPSATSVLNRIHEKSNMLSTMLFLQDLKGQHTPSSLRLTADLVSIPPDHPNRDSLMMISYHLYLIRLQFPYERQPRLDMDIVPGDIEAYEKQAIDGNADPERCADILKAWKIRGVTSDAAALATPIPGDEDVERVIGQMEEHFGRKIPRYGNAPYPFDHVVKPKVWSKGHLYCLIRECLRVMMCWCNRLRVTKCTV